MLMIAAFHTLTGCSDGDPVPPLSKAVQIEGAIGSSTRAVINSGYEKDLEVCFARSDGGGAWRPLPAVRTGGTGRTPIVFTELQFYPSGSKQVKLSGYYPRTGVVDQTSVTFTLTDGATDLMATGPLSGSTPAPITTCTFRHLLTQLKFVCFSNQPELWGKVTKIEVGDIHSRQAYALTAASPLLQPVDAAGVLDLRSIRSAEDATLALYTGSLGVESALFAVQDSILVPTQQSGTEAKPLLLYITTEKGGVGIAKPEGYRHTAWLVVADDDEGITGVQAGYSHRIELFFTNSEIKVVSVSVDPWTPVEMEDPIPL